MQRPRAHDYRAKFELEYGLHGVEYNEDGVVVKAVCKFCTTFGKEEPNMEIISDLKKTSVKKRRVTDTIKYFGPLFRTQNILRHLRKCHHHKWRLYQEVTPITERFSFFTSEWPKNCSLHEKKVVPLSVERTDSVVVNEKVGNPIKVGIVGFGSAGRYLHCGLLKEHRQFVVTHVLERKNVEAKKCIKDVVVVQDMNSMVKSDVELVVVATPPEFHYGQVKVALLEGKHVVVEKPFTVKYAHALELIELAKMKNRVLSVFQNRRFDTEFLTMAEMVEEQILGEITYAEFRFDRYRPKLKPEHSSGAWKEQNRPGTGILYDLGSHLIDQALCLFGQPEKTSGYMEIQREGNLSDDFFQIELKYPKLQVLLTASMTMAEAKPKAVLRGEKGKYVKYELDVQEYQLKNGLTPYTTKDFGVEPAEHNGHLFIALGKNGKLQVAGKMKSIPGRYSAFYDAVATAIESINTNGSDTDSLQNIPDFVTPESVAASIEIIENLATNPLEHTLSC